MKNLVIDIGNTRSKVAVFVRNKLESVYRFDNRETEKMVSAIRSAAPFDNGILSASGSIPASINLELFDIRNLRLVLSPDTQLPVKISYSTPETLGKDRIAGIIGCYTKYHGRNVLLCDLGSAITYDLLTAEGVYPGGNISPGLHMRFRALHEYTAQLPLLDDFDFNEHPGNSTKQAMVNGVVLGIIHELNGVIKLFERKFPDLVLVFTGGDAELFASKIKRSIFADQHIVLKGLNDIIAYNRSI